MIDLLGYVASAAILTVYLLLALGRVPPIVFHWANALGWPPVLVSELAHGAYVPLVLTVFFGVVGTVGVILHYSKRTAKPEPLNPRPGERVLPGGYQGSRPKVKPRPPMRAAERREAA